MELNKKHTIQIFDRSVKDVIDDVARYLPTPRALSQATLHLDLEEEAVLDSLTGMMWPCLFTQGLLMRYHAKKLKAGNITAHISFTEDTQVQLRFTVH